MSASKKEVHGKIEKKQGMKGCHVECVKESRQITAYRVAIA